MCTRRSKRIRWHRIAALAVAMLAMASAPAQVVTSLILRTGDIAPQLGTAPVTIESFVEPPSIVQAALFSFGTDYVPIHVTVAGENVVDLNRHVIYVWSRSSGLQKVVRSGEVASFPEGVRALTGLESPIATRIGRVLFTTQTDRPGRGLVLSQFGSLIGLAEVGQSVSIECQSVSGAPCGPVTGATLATMPTFADRRGAAANAYDEITMGTYAIGVAFRGGVQTTGFGNPDALWFQSYVNGQRGPLANVANSLLKAAGTNATTYYDDFTDLALCLRFGPTWDLYALATVSQGAPQATYSFGPQGPQLLLRHYPPDLAPRRDFHCTGDFLGFAGGVTGSPLDGDISTRGAWTLGQDGTNLSQVYRANTTAAPGIPGAALGTPIGQAVVYDNGAPTSVFAANLVGSALAGAAGVWRGRAPLELIAHEQMATPYGVPIQAIWGVHVNARGDVALHVRLQDQRQAIFVIDNLGRFIPLLLAGNPLPGAAGGALIMDSFWTLGVSFGSDPVVTGPGTDGIQGAFTGTGKIPVVVYTRTAAQPPGTSTGASLLDVEVPLKLFADSFESPPPPE